MQGEIVWWRITFLFAAFLVLQFRTRLVTAQASNSSPWLTLRGDAPSVVAKGGFSGLFPDSSEYAYKFTALTGSPDTISWCDVQLTKDGIGLCLPNIKLDNCTDISQYFPDGKKSYVINGVSTMGWFPVDYDARSLSNISVIQGVLSRSDRFDGALFPILTPQAVDGMVKPSALWLNIQHDTFYREHNLSMRTYVLSLSKSVPVYYISSPEVAFLSSIASRFKRTKTKLFFRFLDEDIPEPSTNQTYGSLLKNLTFIRTFASGILIPKQYIWPVTSDHYLQPHTSIVSDAHKAGLEVYASNFANDAILSYNYSYDPLSEVLSFVDNGAFSVDGVLTDFPVTASAALGCYSHLSKNNSGLGNPVVISHNGASGVYADCTDLAYQQAFEDGADIIDCPVQLTQDGIPICMSSINLMDVTDAATSKLRSRSSVVPDIQSTPGIFTFNLTWEEIQQDLKPAISNPEVKYGLTRNPRNKNSGSFMKLSDFLTFAKSRALAGILIGVEHAAFYAEDIGYSVIDAVIGALKDAGYNNQTTQQVMIQSANSSVLVKFKQQTNYKLVYKLDESVSDVDKSSLSDIKGFATAVVIGKQSVYPTSQLFITGQTDMVKTLQSAGLAVYVYLFRNEFVYQPWDFFSDPNVEINSYVQFIGVDGLITDYPGTATRYRRNSCLKLGDKKPNYMQPVSGGQLLQYVVALPPALSPMPILDSADVIEPPLPAVSTRPSSTGGSALPPAAPSGASRSLINSSCIFLLMLLVLVLY
ncbi:glycerophosphodiester phosphodiesterase GDPDL3-like [Phalaenopsis equestris]|uniref:glycerophosphodiester phosphodiesterase GDPDL3-like n=1 Tax=Phalaenopsis equestris TaxID=78828 RepID=UPI0009E36498|nr:glycerophosphodiester phosphodiesterase GDPDL3-like [Phalaenopsis equestris]